MTLLARNTLGRALLPRGRRFEKVAVRLVAGGSIPGYQGMILTDDSIRSLANRYPRNDEEYAFVSLFKESHLGDKNLSLGAALMTMTGVTGRLRLSLGFSPEKGAPR